jgi:glycosyltransferase involved in cell wall biosynthesis
MALLVVGMRGAGAAAWVEVLEGAGRVDDREDRSSNSRLEQSRLSRDRRAIDDLNNEVVRHLEESWDGTETQMHGWEDPVMEGLLERAATLVSSVSANRPFVLSEPGLGLTVPLWRRALRNHCCGLIVIQDPIEVAMSISREEGISTLTGLARWSFYHRTAIEGLHDLPVFVCQLSELKEDPSHVLGYLTDTLRDWGEIDRVANIDTIVDRLRSIPKDTAESTPQFDHSGPQHDVLALRNILAGAKGRHDVFDLGTLPNRGSWERPLLERRIWKSRAIELEDQLERTQYLLARQIEKKKDVERIPAVRIYRAVQRIKRSRGNPEEPRRLRAHFDSAWYLAQNADVADSAIDPFTHYLRSGEEEGRWPNPDFDPIWYLKSNPDVAESGLGPLTHYTRFGRTEERQIEAPFKEPVRDVEYRQSIEFETRATAGRWYPRSEPAPDLNLENFPNPARLAVRKPTKIVLVVDMSVPLTDEDSGSYRTFQILVLLRRLGYHVVFCANLADGWERHFLALRELGIEVVVGMSNIRKRLTNAKEPIDTVWISRPVNARYFPLTRTFAPSARIIYDTVELHWRSLERKSEFDPTVTKSHIGRVRTLENTLCAWADEVVAVTEDDASMIRGGGLGSRVSIVPNIHEIPRGTVGFESRKDIVFLGGFLHPPNVDAVERFLENIFPLILRELPDLQFSIIGSHLEEVMQIRPTANVIPVGFVPVLEPVLSHFRVMVVPLRYGAGMKGKIGSSLACGLPVVTTAIGAEGIGLQNGLTAIIVDDDELFAQAVVELYRDRARWTEMSELGRAHINQRFSPDSVMGTLSRLMNRSDDD